MGKSIRCKSYSVFLRGIGFVQGMHPQRGFVRSACRMAAISTMTGSSWPVREMVGTQLVKLCPQESQSGAETLDGSWKDVVVNQ